MTKVLVPTVCPYCGAGCGFFIAVEKERATGIEYMPDHPVSEGALCSKGNAALEKAFRKLRVLMDEAPLPARPEPGLDWIGDCGEASFGRRWNGGGPERNQGHPVRKHPCKAAGSKVWSCRAPFPAILQKHVPVIGKMSASDGHDAEQKGDRQKPALPMALKVRIFPRSTPGWSRGSTFRASPVSTVAI